MTEAESEEKAVKNWILAAKRTMQGRPMATKYSRVSKECSERDEWGQQKGHEQMASFRGVGEENTEMRNDKGAQKRTA